MPACFRPAPLNNFFFYKSTLWLYLSIGVGSVYSRSEWIPSKRHCVFVWKWKEITSLYQESLLFSNISRMAFGIWSWFSSSVCVWKSEDAFKSAFLFLSSRIPISSYLLFTVISFLKVHILSFNVDDYYRYKSVRKSVILTKIVDFFDNLMYRIQLSIWKVPFRSQLAASQTPQLPRACCTNQIK